MTKKAGFRTLMQPKLLLLLLVGVLSACGDSSSDSGRGGAGRNTVDAATPLSDLGSSLYFDANLSSPAGQSCASCHLPSAGFADPDDHIPVSEGVIAGRFGNRNSPTASYAVFIPPFGVETLATGGTRFIGGQFWDGRASTLEDQAQGPFLNPLEMNNPDKAAVVEKVRLSAYADDFRTVFGPTALDDVDSAYIRISQAIAAFERTGVFSPFSSRFDDSRQGLITSTDTETRGFVLFSGKAQCIRCHHNPQARGAQVFSDFAFHNIGVPANPNNPFLFLDPSLNPDGTDFVDLGLGAALGDAAENGKFRTQTLRNIKDTPPYMHNGVFNTLEEVVRFYNRRDLDAVVPEVNQNVDNIDNIGELGLTDAEILDLVAFMESLSDAQ